MLIQHLKLTDTEVYVPIVTLSTKDNVELSKQLNEGFKKPVFWIEYKTKIEPKNLDNDNLILILLFKELEDCLFLLLTILTMVIKKLKETVTQNIFFQDYYIPITMH